APAGLERLADAKDVVVVEINPRDGEAARRVLGLLDDRDDLPASRLAGKARDAEALRVRHLLEQEFGPGALGKEIPRGLADIPLDDVVAQHHAHLLTLREVLGQL